MNNLGNPRDIDFKIDKNNLYREESITDLKVASIRRLVPVRADGSDDAGRTPIFVGSTQLMTPEGPLPIQSKLEAKTLAEAFEEFPNAMRQALDEVIAQIQQMQQQQQTDRRNQESRIIVPGR
ncbi:MAG: cytoplasmic protein [Desulfatitalea sp. BRH_c12]|nr:MAG: cytoplasmic protein [Desulfatitalea sp. BRH_c12]